MGKTRTDRKNPPQLRKKSPWDTKKTGMWDKLQRQRRFTESVGDVDQKSWPIAVVCPDERLILGECVELYKGGVFPNTAAEGSDVFEVEVVLASNDENGSTFNGVLNDAFLGVETFDNPLVFCFVVHVDVIEGK